MYIWRHKKLADDLKNGLVTQKQQFLYLLILLLYMALISLRTINSSGAPLNTYDYVVDAITFFFTVLCLTISYRVNGKGDNKDFILRFICVDFPITLKTIIIGTILFIPAAVIDIAIMDPTVFAESETVDLAYEVQNEIEEIEVITGPTILAVYVALYIYMLSCYVSAFKIASGQKEYSK